MSFVLAALWQALLIGSGLVSALVARLRREAPEVDQTEAYELGRWSDRLDHYRRLRDEELAELRRQTARA